MENEVLTAFSVLKEASQLIGKEFEIFVDSNLNKATLIVLDARMEIDVSCDYSIIIEYELWADGRMFSFGTREYESLKWMIAYDGVKDNE